MAKKLMESIRASSQMLEPIATNLPARNSVLPGIRCVMFDIYGTLFISGSGDVGSADDQLPNQSREGVFRTVLKEAGISIPDEAPPLSQMFQEEISVSHSRSGGQGISYPEVEIREIWQGILERLPAVLAGRLFPDGLSSAPQLTAEQIEQLAVNYELATNPVWPMPNCREVLETLHQSGLVMGIISNAQFYTELLFEALLNQDLDDLGFAADLRIFSFAFETAKPGLFLYCEAKKRLAKMGISPGEVLYIGNDILKDISPASRIGFRTGLFAGDARSLRLPKDDDCTQQLKPDVILNNLRDLFQCLPGLSN